MYVGSVLVERLLGLGLIIPPTNEIGGAGGIHKLADGWVVGQLVCW